MSINLETLIRDNAATMAEQMKELAKWAHSEEDIRHECNKLIDDFLKKAGLKIRGRHEYGLAGGRIDSKYGGVIIEYKDPKGAYKLIEDRNSPGVKAVIEQIKKRFQDFEASEKINKERLFAAGCDGDTLVFVRHRGKDFEIEDPQEVTSHNVERLLRAIVSLGARGYSFTPENLTEHFGVDGTIAQKGIHKIYEVICETHSAKAQVFFNQWKIFFGEVCGYNVSSQNIKISKLGEHYAINNVRAAEILFAVHTYYAVFIKLLAAEIVSSFSPLGTSTLKRLITAPTSTKLRVELELLEQGGIWSQLGIRNFLEGDLFSWYLDAWEKRCYETVHDMVVTLDQYDPTTLSVDPNESRDLLKRLYQHLFPKSIRHDLGEYYTPDWLAEHVLNEVSYDGNPDKRVLDPACGSGTFLVMTINRIKLWFQEHRHECGFGEAELLRKILNNVIGFDLNPLAVMAARTNYLLAIRDLLRYGANIELPVYLCDSIMTPSEYGDLFIGSLGRIRKLKTSVEDFLIPLEVTADSEQIGKYADKVEFCILNNYNAEEFISICEAEGISVNEKETHTKLYTQLQRLNSDKKNGVWARIIKNAFAPLFIKAVDYVVGNPPWITWINLPKEYRDNSRYLWVEKYRLMSAGMSSMSNLGQVCKDLSMLFTLVSMDRYLKKEGILGFVITQSVFQSPAGYEFRAFNIPPNRPIQIKSVDDFVALNPFDSATNRTSCFTAILDNATEYPVPYFVWVPDRDEELKMEDTYESIMKSSKKSHKYAFPSSTDPQSVWMITDTAHYIPRLDHSSLIVERYKARKSVQSGLEGAYRVDIAPTRQKGEIIVSNSTKGAKRKVPEIQCIIEDKLVYPYLRGSDCNMFKATCSGYLVVPHTPETGMRPIDEPTMKTSFSKTYSYLLKFKDLLESRAVHQRWGINNPFYSVYNIGPYTFTPWKVVWGRVASRFAAAVIGTYFDSTIGEKLLIPTETVLAIALGSKVEAHFLCAYMNAPQNRAMIERSITIHPDSQILDIIQLPLFNPDDETHRLLSQSSLIAHMFADLGRDTDVILDIIDNLVSIVWGTKDGDLGCTRNKLNQLEESIDTSSLKTKTL